MHIRTNNRGRLLLGAILALLFLTACQDQQAPETPAPEQEIDKEAVQAAMHAYIQAKLDAGGTYDVQGVAATFDHLHNRMKEQEGFYRSCADFKAADDVYDMDYYVKADGAQYRVVKEVLHKKNGEDVNAVLWQE